MSKIDELLAQYCPNGVSYEKLGELGRFYGGLTGKSKTDFVDGNAIFITYKNVYSNPALDIHPMDTVKIAEGENQRTLEYGDIIFTGSSETPDECGFSSVVTEHPTEKLYLNSFCFFFRFNNLEIMNPHFAKHLFRSDNLRHQIGKTASGVTRFNVSKDKMANVVIPIPPLEVQREIVRILDNFTEHTEVIEKELNARKMQFRHYSTVLFDKAKLHGQYQVSELCFMEKGKTPIQKATPGDYPMVVTTSERKSCDTYQFDCEAVCIPLVSSRGHGVASLNHVYYQDGKFALGNILCALSPKDSRMLTKYMFYYFEQTKDHSLVPLMKGGANVSLHMEDIAKVKIPTPSIAEQKHIINILDRFQELCDVIETELALRKDQLVFYRDKLLTFKELA